MFQISNKNRSFALSSALLLLGAAAAPLAGAQNNQGDAVLEEIVVTAQKRAENLQDTPIAVSAITGEMISKLAIDSTSAIATRNPSLVYSEAGGESQLYIRGIGSNIFSVGVDQSIATHIDGIYTGRANMGLTQFLDVERVEILRGPQGTLYGRNATGGAINIISAQPTDTLQGYATLGTGSFSRREFKGALSGPLGGSGFSARVAVRSLDDDGYTKNVDPRGTNKIDDNDLKAGRAILRYSNDTLTASLAADYSKFKNGNTSIYPLDSVGLAQSFGAVATGDPHVTRNNTPSFHNWRTGGVTLTADWKFNDSLTLSSVSGYREWDSDFLFNTDGTEIEITRSTFIYDSVQYSSELRLAGDHTWGNWLLGAYWFKEDKFGALGLVRVGFTPPTVLSPRSFDFFADGSGRATAMFGQVNYKVNDQLSLTAGIRYSDETKSDLLRSTTLVPDTALLGLFASTSPPAATAAGTRNVSRSWTAVTPRLGLEWRPAENRLYYLSYSRGFKSGGFNDLSVINPPFNPEFVKSYEIGAKTELFDRRLRFNATVFKYDYTDLQVSVFSSLGNITTTFTTNAAAATINGVELEMQAKPTRNLEITANISWLDATYDSFTTPYGTCNATNAALDSRCVGRAGLPRLIDASGNRLNNAPEAAGSLSLQYDIDVSSGGKVSLLGQVSHRDRVYFLPANPAAMSEAGYSLFDARVSYASAGGAWEIGAYGKNLGDTDYFQNRVQFTSTSDGRNDPFNTGSVLGYVAPGRQWGVDFTYRFGESK